MFLVSKKYDAKPGTCQWEAGVKISYSKLKCLLDSSNSYQVLRGKQAGEAVKGKKVMHQKDINNNYSLFFYFRQQFNS